MNWKALSIVTIVCSLLLSCGGGGGSDSGSRGGGSERSNFGCDGGCTGSFLDTSEVARILRQGVAAAEAFGVAATFAVLDRVGNVLAVYAMPGASPTTRINGK